MINDIEKFLSSYGWKIYPGSFRKFSEDKYLFVGKKDKEKKIGLVNGQSLLLSFPYYSQDLYYGPQKIYINFYPLTFENYLKLKKVYNLSPTVCDKKTSFGTGDRLGLVSSAHLRVLKDYEVFPVIIQQSPRELIKTHRDFKDVLLKGVLGFLESGYNGNFGADADHIKDEEYLKSAIEAGYTMYTIDISDFLVKISSLDKGDIYDRVRNISDFGKKIINKYAGKKLKEKDFEYEFNEDRLIESAITYENGLKFIEKVYAILEDNLKDYNLEVSIDEGERDTTLEDHLFVAEYLHERGIDFWSLAPKFPGEFQKALDYKGDINKFAEELRKHYIVAKKIEGYRLSLHSGSDKFSIYKDFSKITEKNFHIKTSGTSWLQAIRLIAKFDKELFLELYHIALENLEESKKAYKVDIKKEDFPKEPNLDLLEFFEKPEVKQLFHISYGALLDERRSEIYNILDRYEEEHYELVAENIKKHLVKIFEEV
ncbi:MAG: hypothetical protein CBR30_05765 [Dictyoglomus sp. NZ13-RE01]|nr:MAG: hypothetical protein CBR30_05765 [Dictyoglomus sp. NZ13-RE01]